MLRIEDDDENLGRLLLVQKLRYVVDHYILNE